MRIYQIIFLFFAVLFTFQNTHLMEQEPLSDRHFTALVIAQRERLRSLPPRESGEYHAILKDVTSFIEMAAQAHKNLAGQSLDKIIYDNKLGNDLYDIAFRNNYRAAMSWLAQNKLVNFHIIVINASGYELQISGIGRILPNETKEVGALDLKFPITIQGYGAQWSKVVKPREVRAEELMGEIAKFNQPTSVATRVTLKVTGWVPRYSIKLSYAPIGKRELIKTSPEIKSENPLELFPLLSKHNLLNIISFEEILNWPDATRAKDPLLQEGVTIQLAGKYKKRDIYRYILKLFTDYTLREIQQQFDSLTAELNKAYVSLSRYKNDPLPARKDQIIAVAQQLLQKAYRNLMIDKGGFPKGVEILE